MPTRVLIVGGGGRYLVLHMPEVRKLAIFDAKTGKRLQEVDGSSSVKRAVDSLHPFSSRGGQALPRTAPSR